MTTKTLTIMEDAYDLLAKNKLEGESFSDEIRRLLSARKRTEILKRYFGILSDAEGKEMMDDLKERRKTNIKLARDRAI